MLLGINRRLINCLHFKLHIFLGNRLANILISFVKRNALQIILFRHYSLQAWPVLFRTCIL